MMRSNAICVTVLLVWYEMIIFVCLSLDSTCVRKRAQRAYLGFGVGNIYSECPE
jgi:hypothetical protein